jgi:hypothetical protein
MLDRFEQASSIMVERFFAVHLAVVTGHLGDSRVRAQIFSFMRTTKLSFRFGPDLRMHYSSGLYMPGHHGVWEPSNRPGLIARVWKRKETCML